MGNLIVTKLDSQTVELKVPEQVSQVDLASFKQDVLARIISYTASRDKYIELLADEQAKLEPS